MACCSFAYSRRTASSSCSCDRVLSVRAAAELVDEFRRGCASPVRLVASAGLFPSKLREVFCFSAFFMIVIISSYEFVTYAVHGQKKTRLIRNGLQFLANPNDMRIDCTSSRKILVTPNLVEQPIAAQRLSGMT